MSTIETPGDDVHRRPARRRLTAWAVASALVMLSGLVASRWVRSPQQVLADQGPPAPSVLTAPAERRVLTDTVVLRGTVGASGTYEVTPAPSGGGKAVVTGVRVSAGQTLAAGAVLVEVGGRPLIALPGPVPTYRDLRPGASGRDVEQLQAALSALGFPAGSGGTLGAETKTALAAFYRSLGYEPATSGDESEVRGARQSVRAAERAVADAQQAVTAPQAVTDGSVTSDGAEAGRRLRYAREDLAMAREELAGAERETGPMLPLSEVVFLPEFPARVTGSKAVVGAEVDDPLLTLSSGPLQVRTTLNAGQRALVNPGMAVQLHDEILGRGVRAVIVSVGEAVADAETGDRGHPLVVGPAEGQLDTAFAGHDVRVTVEAASTEGEVLVVPVSALFSQADGRTSILRAVPAGEPERIVVDVGVSGDGYAAVTPAGGTLDPGDRVIVGSAEHREVGR